MTSEALREAGLEPDVEAEPHTPDGLVDALVADAPRLMRPVTFLSDYGLADEFVGVCTA